MGRICFVTLKHVTSHLSCSSLEQRWTVQTLCQCVDGEMCPSQFIPSSSTFLVSTKRSIARGTHIMDSPPFLWADQQKMVYFCFEPCTVEYTVSNNLFAFGEHFVPLYKLKPQFIMIHLFPTADCFPTNSWKALCWTSSKLTTFVRNSFSDFLMCNLTFTCALTCTVLKITIHPTQQASFFPKNFLGWSASIWTGEIYKITHMHTKWRNI